MKVNRLAIINMWQKLGMAAVESRMGPEKLFSNFNEAQLISTKMLS